jgi:hypothetical protein
MIEGSRGRQGACVGLGVPFLGLQAVQSSIIRINLITPLLL